MAGELSFNEIANLGKERVAEKTRFIGENETPLFDYFMSRKKKPLDEQGYRQPVITARPGGHNFYGQNSADFRTPVALDSDSMRTYPVWYEIGQKFTGATLRAMRKGSETQLLNYTNVIGQLTDAAKKRLNAIFHGDGTAVVSVCNSAALSGTGAKTYTGNLLASAAVGEAETKGARRLEKGHTYALIDTDGVTINSIFSVTTPGTTTATVNVLVYNATSAAGDMVVDLGSSNTLTAYKKAPQGLRSLCAASGVLQNIDRSSDTNFKTPRVNANDLPVTPYLFANAKTLVRIAGNDMMADEGKVIVATPGQETILRVQQFGYRQVQGNEAVKGVAKKYIDADGDTYIFDADGAEDRIYILDGNSFYLGEEKSFGLFNEDGNDLRMGPGANSVGSDGFYLAIGWGGNLIKDVTSSSVQKDAYIDRLSQTDVQMQSSL